MKTTLTAIIEKEADGYVALCPDMDVASQSDTVDEAHKNLTEASELVFECASAEEIKERSRGEMYITPITVSGNGQ